MPTKKTEEVETAPEVWHALIAGLTVPHDGASPEPAKVLPLGGQITLTADFVEHVRDRNSESWAEDLSDEAQVERWGQVRWRKGALADNLALSLELDAARVQEAAREQQERLLQAHRYGRRYAAARADAIEALRA